MRSMVDTNLDGRVCMVTGANTGIGRVTALELARAGGHVILACRSEAKAMPVAEEIKAETGNDKVEFHPLDLNSLAKVKESATSWLERDLPLHILVNNAGLAGHRGQTEDGFELQFGVNHMGPFLFTLLLKERIEASGPARIVNVASRAHTRVKGMDYSGVESKTKTIAGFKEYCYSKLANVLFNIELAKRLAKGTTTYALHPGVIKSDIWRRIPWPIRPLVEMRMISVEEGAMTSLYCATSDACAGESGLYYDKSQPKATNKAATGDAAAELWAKSEEWCASFL